MSEHTHPSWVEAEAAKALVPENRRAEFLARLDGASWVPVKETHPFLQAYAVRTALSGVPDAHEATYSQIWTTPGQEGERHHTVVGLRTSRQEIFFLDDGDVTMQGVLIRPSSTPLWGTRQEGARALTSGKTPGAAPAAPVPTAPETGARKYQGPTPAQVREIAGLVVGEDVTLLLAVLDNISEEDVALPFTVLAVIADSRARLQGRKGAKAAASQYRQCAHHLRQAAETLARADDHTDEEQAATEDMAGAYVEAAATHAREADLTAI
ncbi:hypothetical protein [Streptomyces botrytidirepellens]|uniref:hypothetical protein n=1 Tax=Streptomyces botrytidirepellens TaxID=2486417 RepID=UPI00162189ED|nr:hypothetical protein [Streptomyces botrytidirepellens]